MTRPRLYSGMQPSADSLQIGNYIGALMQWRELQESYDAFFCVVNLHAITVAQDPAELVKQVRIALAPAIVQQIYGPTNELSVIAIEPGLEHLLVQALAGSNGPALDPGVADLLTHKAAEVANKQEELGIPACLLVPDAIRSTIARLVRRMAPRLQVLSHSEIPESHTIRIGPVLKGATS